MRGLSQPRRQRGRAIDTSLRQLGHYLALPTLSRAQAWYFSVTGDSSFMVNSYYSSRANGRTVFKSTVRSRSICTRLTMTWKKNLPARVDASV